MLKPHKKLRPKQKPMQKYIWHTQPRKSYDLRKMLTQVKKYFDPYNPRNPPKNLTHATYVLT